MLTTAWEPLDRLLADGLEDLSFEHWEEAGTFRESVPLAVDWQRRREMERIATFRVMGARIEGELVGYCSWFILPHSQYRMTLTAFNDTIFLAKKWRMGWNGIRLVRDPERDLWRAGIKMIRYEDTPVGATIGELLRKLGYIRVGESHAKIAGDI